MRGVGVRTSFASAFSFCFRQPLGMVDQIGRGELFATLLGEGFVLLLVLEVLSVVREKICIPDFFFVSKM